MTHHQSGKRYLWLVLFWSVFIWSAIKPHDYFTWALEVLPALVAFIIIVAIYKKFQFTQLVIWLILLHAIILMIGGHYTYAHVPPFDWFKEIFGFQRNHYDKVGHFFQGFVPALVARELLIRNNVLIKRGWLPFIIISICLAISAFYELIEWWAAVLIEEAAESFLGTQGYIWDTQSDMAYALAGALLALLCLSKKHDQQLKSILDNQRNL